MPLPLIEIILIAVGLGADAFSVSLAAGAQGFKPRRIFRLSFHFGLFQFMMPIIGWFLGELLAKLIGDMGCWVVLIVLCLIGGKMIYDGFGDEPKDLPDLSKGWKMVSLSIATSIDALGIGFSFGLSNIAVLKPAVIIGIICAVMTIIGLYLGVRMHKKLGHKALIIGGTILIFIGIKTIL